MKRKIPVSFFAGMATLLSLLVFVILCFTAETPKTSTNRTINQDKASVKAEVIVPKMSDNAVQGTQQGLAEEEIAE